MYKVAIVEDEEKILNVLLEYFNKFSNGENLFSIHTFKNGLEFLNKYTRDFDLVFMDIMMPSMDGMDASKKLREIDDNIQIIFCTTMAKYALFGYEVHAFDYLVKPISYELFEIKLKKVITKIDQKESDELLIKQTNNTVRVKFSSIVYIESVKHYIFFHTIDGEEYKVRGTLKEFMNTYKRDFLAFASNTLIVNLKYVKSFQKNEINVGKNTFLVSKSHKKDFFEKLTNYLGKC